MSYKVDFKSKWADFDPNGHMRHSAYNDYAAECRARFFKEYGFDLNRVQKLNIGPILFNEFTNFHREIRMGQDLSVEMFLEGLSENGERFKIQHKIIREDGVLAATISVYGAFLDLIKRKLTRPPQEVMTMFDKLEHTENYQNIPLKSKTES